MKKIQIVILTIMSEHSKAVKELKLDVGDYFVAKLGDFHDEINNLEFLRVFEFGVCPEYTYNGHEKITEKKAKELKRNILKIKDKEMYQKLENEELKAELQALKAQKTKKEEPKKDS